MNENMLSGASQGKCDKPPPRIRGNWLAKAASEYVNVRFAEGVRDTKYMNDMMIHR